MRSSAVIDVRNRRLVRYLIGLIVLMLLSACASTSGGNRGSRKTANESGPATAAVTNVQLAMGYMEQGKTEIALEKIERAMKIDPTYADAFTVAGYIYERIGDNDAAGEHYHRAVRLAGDNGQILNNYGQFLCKSGKPEKALEQFEHSVRDPFYQTPEVALTNAGACAERVEHADAEQYYRRALAANENYVDALYRMSVLMLNNGEAMKARAFLQRYESRSRRSDEALRLGRDIENALGNDEGVTEYEQRLRRQSQHPASR